MLPQTTPASPVMMDDHFPCLGLQEKAGADLTDTDVPKPQELQFPSLQSALKTDWCSLYPRRSHKLICLLAGDHCTNCNFTTPCWVFVQDKTVHEGAAGHMLKTSHAGSVCWHVTHARPSALWGESHRMSACFVRMPFVPALRCLHFKF